MSALVIMEMGRIRTFTLQGKESFSLGNRAVAYENHKEANTLNPNWKFREWDDNPVPDITLECKYVSRQHGVFCLKAGKWQFKECGSINGTYYNGELIRPYDGAYREIPLRDGDRLSVHDPDAEAGEEDVCISFFGMDLKSGWIKFDLHAGQQVRIGASTAGNDIVVESRYVSSKHAVVSVGDRSAATIQNIGVNGVKVNGKMIRSKMILMNHDAIHIGDRLMVYMDESLYYENMRADESPADFDSLFILQAHIHTKKVKNKSGSGYKELLRDVNLSVREGSLIALLGNSGAGKTTLMNCLNGMDTKGMEGSVMYYGEDLIADFDRLKYQIGSVPQENVFHEVLTVEKELKAAAKLRLPKKTSRNEINGQIDRTIAQLGLEHVRKNQISLCSGGEKKRVNIAIDLVADRNLLCLDEPDAGLDPAMKRELFEILHRLAHKDKKTILVIIHDVSELQLFDQIIMMAKMENVGRLAFFGTPEEAEKYFGTSVKDAYRLLTEAPEKYIRA